MSKGLKITLYIILILAIIAVIWLMFGNTNHSINTPTEINNEEEVLTGETIIQTEPEITNTDSSFEEDVMKDLEGFFGNSNGYENVEGEFGFINAAAE